MGCYDHDQDKLFVNMCALLILVNPGEHVTIVCVQYFIRSGSTKVFIREKWATYSVHSPGRLGQSLVGR